MLRAGGGIGHGDEEEPAVYLGAAAGTAAEEEQYEISAAGRNSREAALAVPPFDVCFVVRREVEGRIAGLQGRQVRVHRAAACGEP